MPDIHPLRRNGFSFIASIFLLSACGTYPPVNPTSDNSPQATSPRQAGSGSRPAMSAMRPSPALASIEPPPPDPESNIFFDSGSYRVGNHGRQLLQKIAEKLKSTNRTDVTLVGHTDDAGSTEFNIALAQKRVDAVATELEDLGVSSRQIRRISYGNEGAIVQSCSSPRCRENQRRVELRLSAED